MKKNILEYSCVRQNCRSHSAWENSAVVRKYGAGNQIWVSFDTNINKK